MGALLQFIAGMLPSHKEDPAKADQADELTPDQVAYARELAEQQRRIWAAKKNETR
jgi:hypothetical protein